jgi:hypothetical protein
MVSISANHLRKIIGANWVNLRRGPIYGENPYNNGIWSLN